MGILKIKKSLPAGRQGFTMIEVLAVVAILAILITMSIFTFMTQLTKGRDARRKADLEKMKTVLEDYLNDSSCYPADLPFGGDFTPYLSQLPADPLDNTYYNYFYSYDGSPGVVCKSWYKIYAKLENTADPIIIKVGCRESTECPLGGCGPSCNYNYWVSSPNMNKVNQILPAENWWTAIPTSWPTSPPLPTNTPPIVSTPTPTSIPAGPTSTPPPAGGPTSTPAPTPTPGGFFGFYGCKEGDCVEIWGICPQAGEEGNCECPNANYRLSDCGGQCVNPPNQCH